MIYKKIECSFCDKCKIIKVSRKYFNDNNGLNEMKEKSLKNIEFDTQKKYLALSCFVLYVLHRHV